MSTNFGQSYVKHFYIRYDYFSAKGQDNQSRVKLFKETRKCCQNVIRYCIEAPK